MSDNFLGPTFLIGDKVRVKTESKSLFKHHLPEHEVTDTLFSVKSTRIKKVEGLPDGMPYSSDYTFQLITLKEFTDPTKEVSASHFEKV